MSSTGRKSVTFKDTGETAALRLDEDGCAGCQLREREKADAMALARGTQRLLLRNQEAYFRLEDACREMQRRHKESTGQLAQQNSALLADKCEVEAKLARAYIELAELRQIREQYNWMKEHWPLTSQPRSSGDDSCAPIDIKHDSCAPIDVERQDSCDVKCHDRCAPMRRDGALVDDSQRLDDLTEQATPSAEIKENHELIGRPSRRATATLCYREPALNVKLRQGRAPWPFG